MCRPMEQLFCDVPAALKEDLAKHLRHAEWSKLGVAFLRTPLLPVDAQVGVLNCYY